MIPPAKPAFLDYVENIDPRVKPRCQELDIKYCETPAANDLPVERYGVLDRRLRARVELFREENIPRQTSEAKLEQQYQEISGAQMVEFDGREQTLQQLALYAERTRPVRSTSGVGGGSQPSALRTSRRWRTSSMNSSSSAIRSPATPTARTTSNTRSRRCNDSTTRRRVASRFTTPSRRRRYRSRERCSASVRRRSASTRCDRGIWRWTSQGRPPLRPFETADELCTKVSRVFHRIDPELGGQFEDMRARGYLDLESRKGKAPGGYQATYEASRHPFIFMNAVGVQRDVRTLVHEGGHAFHCYAARHDPIVAYRSSPIEFAEVASFGMEMLSLELIDEFYEGAELDRARRSQLEGIIGLFPWIATIDAFQHFLYAHPDHSRDQRRAEWLRLRDRFAAESPTTPDMKRRWACSWHRQLHLFEVPFYYIEYGIAKLGALQVWRNAMQDRPAAVANYRAALSLGGSRPLPELFETAGAKFDFSIDTIAPLMELLRTELDKLPI